MNGDAYLDGIVSKEPDVWGRDILAGVASVLMLRDRRARRLTYEASLCWRSIVERYRIHHDQIRNSSISVPNK